MFTPNNNCRIQLASSETDVHGQPILGRWLTEKCSIVRLPVQSQKTSVRADSSASRGAAQELETNAKILLGARTKASIDDLVKVAGIDLRIVSKEPRYDAGGRLDHYEINLTYWSA